MDILKWIQNWYASNCDGDWEHFYGVKIETLDNPGWYVDIDLAETCLEGKPFEKIQYGIDSNDDWIICFVKDNIFHGTGDPQKLDTILLIFKEWVENCEKGCI